MPKKTNKQPQNDFFFFIVISVFAILTIFAAGYMGNVRKAAIQASQQKALDVAPLDIVPQK